MFGQVFRVLALVNWPSVFSPFSIDIHNHLSELGLLIIELHRTPPHFSMGNNRNFFALDDAFWENYLKRRPRVADSFFDRIFNYHRASFGAVHDTGAGNGPYAQRLRSRFYHVIVSDIMAENAELARHRLQGAKGFSFRTSPLKEADDIEAGSVDMIFATNATHFPESQDTAMDAVARQLRPGGTFTAAGFAPVRFHDAQLQDLWDRISREGGQQLLSRANNPRETIRFMLRTQGRYNVAPLPQGTSTPGALDRKSVV